MPDTFTKKKRSEIMGRVKSAGNIATEVRLIKIFRKYHVTGWRRKQRVFGSPDFVFKERKLAIFVDGCFWHGCPIHGEIPVKNRTFWRRKILRNVERDRLVTRSLKSESWKVLRIWQHELGSRNQSKLADKVVARLSAK